MTSNFRVVRVVIKSPQISDVIGKKKLGRSKMAEKMLDVAVS